MDEEAVKEIAGAGLVTIDIYILRTYRSRELLVSFPAYENFMLISLMISTYFHDKLLLDPIIQKPLSSMTVKITIDRTNFQRQEAR